MEDTFLSDTANASHPATEEKRLIFNDIKQLITEFIQKIIQSEDEIDETKSLEDIGVNSMLFINLVVAIEQRLGIEFDDQALNFSRYPDIQNLFHYVFDKYNDTFKF